MPPYKLSAEDRYEIYQKFLAGERKCALAKEFSVNEATVRRIIKHFSYEAEKSVVKTPDAVNLEEQYTPEQTYKLKVRVPAVTVPITPLTRATAPVNALTEKPKEQPGNTSMSSVTDTDSKLLSISPLGVQLEPYYIYRSRGSLKHATADGSVVVLNTDGRAVAVERCPVYNEKWSMVCYRKINITSSDGKEIRGEVQQWDGETIPGKVVIWGVTGKEGSTVTRVEFHPDKFPEAYRKSEEEFRERVG